MSDLETEALQIVSDINEKINDAAYHANVAKDHEAEDALYQLKASFTSDGDYCSITFLGIDVWNSANDEREYVNVDTLDEDLEPLSLFVYRRIAKYTSIVNTLAIVPKL